MDGRVVTKLRLSGAAQTVGVKPGMTPDEQAMIVIQFLDQDRNQIASIGLARLPAIAVGKKKRRRFPCRQIAAKPSCA